MSETAWKNIQAADQQHRLGGFYGDAADRSGLGDSGRLYRSRSGGQTGERQPGAEVQNFAWSADAEPDDGEFFGGKAALVPPNGSERSGGGIRPGGATRDENTGLDG